MCLPNELRKKNRSRRQPTFSTRERPRQQRKRGRASRFVVPYLGVPEPAMSLSSEVRRVTVPEIRGRKNQKPVVCLTCYHAHTARLLDEHVDIMLVGDSLGMVMHGMETTLPVSLELMILHCQAVMRGSRRALVVLDMPFGSYEESPEIAFRNASRA